MRCRWVGGLLLAASLGAQQYRLIPVPQSPRRIEHILEDHRGRLWISTHDDVLCFDGTGFFSLRPFGFPAIGANSLTEDLDGGILISSALGVHRYFGGRLEHILADVVVYNAIGVSPGVLLAATIRGGSPTPWRNDGGRLLYRIRRRAGDWHAEALTGWDLGPVLSRDRAGTVLAACPGGWCELPARLIEDWTPEHPGRPVLHESGMEVGRILRDRSGCLWFRSSEAAAYQCAGDSKPIPLPVSVAGRNVWADVQETRDGAVLFASVGSLALGRPGSFQVVSPDNGLPTESVSCAVQARDGTIWTGTLGGLYRFPYPFRLTYWKSRHGLVWAFAKSDGAMLAGTSAGVARLGRDGGWSVLSGSRQFGSISSVLPEAGGIYAAVALEAVIRLGTDGALLARTPPGAGGRANGLAQSADGTIWLSGSGFYRVVARGRELALIADNPPGGSPPDAAIAADAQGNLWGCFPGTVVRRAEGGWRTLARDGLPQSACWGLAFPTPRDACAGFNNGFASLRLRSQDAATVRNFSTGAFRTVATFGIASDARGRLWRGSSDGMNVADPENADQGIWLHLDEKDGLPDVDVNHGSIFADPDGSIWWGAATSIYHFVPPADLTHPAAPPAVFLSAISVDGGSPEFAEALAPLPGGRTFTAHLGALQFQARDALRVRYRLLPQQREWRETAALDLDLGKLWWGTHRLEIQSRLLTGSWSPVLSETLSVVHPWWLSLPAMAALAGIAFVGSIGTFRWRARRRARARTALPDLAGWRLAVLTPEIELLGTTLEGRFEVGSLVARGGFATIFEGHDLHCSGRRCAIKAFRGGVIDPQWLAHRFEQEIAALEQIRHPSVVSIYGHGMTPGGAPFLAMEFVEGGTLRDLLEHGPLSRFQTASLLRQAAAALERIHSQGIFHRDLKPENLMLRAGAPAGEELVLIDFSIAIVKEPDQTMHGLSRAAGTIYYMAPEQAVGFATPASDIYSLAKIVLEMLTGRRLTALLPDASMDLPDRVGDLLRERAIPLTAGSVELLCSALEFDPSRRPQRAEPFALPIARDLAAPSGPSASPGPCSRDAGLASG